MKGFFTQAVVVLFESAPDVKAVEAALAGSTVLRRVPAGEAWEFGGEGLVLDYRTPVNGLISVDVVEHPWPDHMGSKDEPTLFGAWSMGHFGPFAYPGGLQRAVEQSWAWSDAAAAVDQHRGFVRLRLSYVFGADDDEPIMPIDCDPVDELARICGLARQLLSAPGALAYFNPNGELLLGAAEIAAAVEHAASAKLEPLDLWSNVRMFNLADVGWHLMDSVGMAQVDLPDLEAVYEGDSHDANEVAGFLRNAAAYLLSEGEVIEDDDTMDGPGGIRWWARRCDASLIEPPRATLRWFPEDCPDPPELLLATASEDEEPDQIGPAQAGPSSAARG